MPNKVDVYLVGVSFDVQYISYPVTVYILCLSHGSAHLIIHMTFTAYMLALKSIDKTITCIMLEDSETFFFPSDFIIHGLKYNFLQLLHAEYFFMVHFYFAKFFIKYSFKNKIQSVK